MSKNTQAENTRLLKQVIKVQSILAQAQFNLDVFMQMIASEMHEITPATGAVVELVEGDFMVYKSVSGTVSDYLGLRLPMANSISGLCIRTNQVLISPDTEIDPRVNLEACRRVSARSMIVAPLVYAEKPVGVLKILSKYPDAFNSFHVEVLELMAGFIASGLKHQLMFQEKEDAIRKLKKTQKRLSYMTKHDFLTKLPNRKFFTTVLCHAMEKVKRRQGMLALMFLDIDHFKWVNDNLGHATGDTLLIKFATFLTKSVRKYDFVVRLGGDEFVILLDDLQYEKDATDIAKKIIENFQKIAFLKKIERKIGTSIGIAFYHGEALTTHELIKQADDALYQVKTEGKNHYRIYCSSGQKKKR